MDPLRPEPEPHARSERIGLGRRAYAGRAWGDAYNALANADRETPLDVDDLERLAWSAGLSGRDDDMLRVLERLYQEHLDAGESMRAARAAFWLCFRLSHIGETGRAGGWLVRAQRLVEPRNGSCVEEGYVLLPLANRAFTSGDWEGARTLAVRAADIGERFAEADLIAVARSLQGWALVRGGRIEAGLALLDEVMLGATTNDLSPVVTGVVYCSVIGCCQLVMAFDRAREWTAALTAWCDAQPQLVTFTGTCLVHRIEILQVGGAWHEASAEVERASERIGVANDPRAAADAVYQKAEIHRLRGEFAQAEESYRSASQRGRDPQPGFALLRVAQGRHEAAANAIRPVLGSTKDRLQRTRFLPAHVEIMLAAGEIEEARASARELEEIAAGYDTEILSALAAGARGAVQLAEGDAQGAIGPLRHAFSVWQQAGAPYIAARLRVLVGLACRALGDEEGSALELTAAREVFERLGATPDRERVDAFGRIPSGPRHGLTPRELQVVRVVASGKTNKAIAQALGVSEKTVDRHVSNIFAKLGIASRAALTAWAYEHELV